MRSFLNYLILFIVAILSTNSFASNNEEPHCRRIPAHPLISEFSENSNLREFNADEAQVINRIIRGFIFFNIETAGSGFVAFKRSASAVILTASHVARVETIFPAQEPGRFVFSYPKLLETGIDISSNREIRFRRKENGDAIPGARLFTPEFSFSLVGPVSPLELIPPMLDFSFIESLPPNMEDVPTPEWANPVIGDQVFAIGNASGQGLVVSGGCVQKIDETGVFRISAPSYPGMSGGPVFDRYGHIVGMIVRGSEVSHDGVAISMQTIRLQLRDAMSDSKLRDYLLQTELPTLMKLQRLDF